MKDWAVILGSSSGFGAATCRALASRGINIYGIHLDRKAAMDSINSLVDELKSNNVEVHFKNMRKAGALTAKILDKIQNIVIYTNGTILPTNSTNFWAMTTTE